MMEALTKCFEALANVKSYEDKKRVLACLFLLFGMNPYKPLTNPEKGVDNS